MIDDLMDTALEPGISDKLLVSVQDSGVGIKAQDPSSLFKMFGRLKKEDHDITDSPVSPAQLGGIIDLISSDAISGKIAKDLFEIVYTDGGDPAQIVEERGMKQVTDTGAIEAALDEIFAANPEQVEKAKENPKLAGWVVGQVIKAMGGKANPKAVNQLIAQKLKD